MPERKKKTSHTPDSKRTAFDGGTAALLGTRMLCALVAVLSLGLAGSWCICRWERWKVSHTVLNGRRLCFTGSAKELTGHYLRWYALTVLTAGIWGIWMAVRVRKWVTEHTVYADEPENTDSGYTATTGQWLLSRLGWLALTVLTLGIGAAWAQARLLRWDAEHTRIGGCALRFRGSGGQLLLQALKLVALAVVTVGVYGVFFPAAYRRWKYALTMPVYAVEPYAAKSRAHEQTVAEDAERILSAFRESQLERIKSGITGEESEEFLTQAANDGNRSAMYELALRKKGEEETFSGEALELLKACAIRGYSPAMTDYALTLGSGEGALYARLLEESAFGGSLRAPWLLQEHYAGIARIRHEKGDFDSAQQLQKAAYWYALALRINDGDALREKTGYERMVRTIAVWMTERQVEKKKKTHKPLAVAACIAVVAAAVAAVLLTKPEQPEVQEPASQVQLLREETVVADGGVLFRHVPWEEGVVSSENLCLKNTTDKPLTVTVTLNADTAPNALGGLVLERRVSSGDLNSIMNQGAAFIPLETFCVTRTLQPGEEYRFALIVYCDSDPGSGEKAVHVRLNWEEK